MVKELNGYKVGQGVEAEAQELYRKKVNTMFQYDTDNQKLYTSRVATRPDAFSILNTNI